MFFILLVASSNKAFSYNCTDTSNCLLKAKPTYLPTFFSFFYLLGRQHTINIYTHNAHNDRPTATIYPRHSIRDNTSALLHPRPIPKGTNGRILVLQKKLTPVRTGGVRPQSCQHSFLRATPAKCRTTEV